MIQQAVKNKWNLTANPYSRIVPTNQSPDTKSLASTNITLLKLGARALRKDLVTTHTLCSCGHRYPGDSKLCGALADLPSIGRANRLSGGGASASGR